MPGLLKPDARCPVCQDPLLALVDSTRYAGMPGGVVITRKYFHDKFGPKTRRRRPCKESFDDFALAQRRRRALEIRTTRRR